MTSYNVDSDVAGNDADGDLPTSLPSYVPPTTSSPFPPPAPAMRYGLQPQFAAPQISTSELPHGSTTGHWKPSTQYLYPKPGPTNATQAHDASNGDIRIHDNGEPSPSTGLQTLSFHDPNIRPGDVKRSQPPEIAGISAAQFAASTGGLTMDPTLLARVSGTDPSLIGSEEIQQIMRTPDLLSIYQKLQEEDDRRQRRLERNRASARIRREKKKNMVETYEGEVAKLENALQMLRSHQFGAGQASDLQCALEYNSGESLRHALMSKEAKSELIKQILGQHSQNTSAIQKANMENQMLAMTATDNSELAMSLRTQLRLTNEQCQQLQSIEASTRQEARILAAINKCFSALRVRDWLQFPGIESLLHQTRATMTAQQFQRFLTWTSDNREVVELLQIIQSSSDMDKDLEFMFVEE